MSPKVLVAEDDPTCKAILLNAVEKAGCTAVGCDDGLEAWETINANPDFALLITDVAMPRMHGRELLQTVRRDERFRKLPAIIISAVLSAEELEDLLAFGPTRFISKPLNAPQLAEDIRAFLVDQAQE